MINSVIEGHSCKITDYFFSSDRSSRGESSSAFLRAGEVLNILTISSVDLFFVSGTLKNVKATNITSSTMNGINT